ncbi:MAG: glycosyltransferase [Acidimicrobiia bacterium]|nr:glycosyltransferase [Acidimicrobiia bacterium]MYE73016.1 glycosyltransferase [Acidimicrobiia bacterium]MYJ61363.1 glycosyltransferase [Acidimicrobiia bacterium]
MTQNVAVLSLHTSPLTQPGVGDSGGMNVYVREMAAALSHAGSECRVYVRRAHHGLPDEVSIEPGVTVVHIDAGPVDLDKEDLYGVVGEFADGVLADFKRNGPPDVIHANYWLSGVAGHRVKHAVGVPLAVTFHTLARVKAATGDPESEQRAGAESEVIGCADVVIASCEPEAQQLQSFYGAPPERIELAPPGVEHALFSPGDREGARAALGLGSGPILLFVGRIQPLKRPLVAVETLSLLDREDARLMVVGGPSGVEGEAEYRRLQDRIQSLGLADRVALIPPRPHHWLSTYYRAADVVLVPSRSESFGLVALEAAASGTPVVAAPVGGLRSVVDHGRTGFLVDDATPEAFAAQVAALIDKPLLAAEMAMNAAERARLFSWTAMARSLQATYRRAQSRVPVDCT